MAETTSPKSFVFVLMPFTKNQMIFTSLVSKQLAKKPEHIANEWMNKSLLKAFWIEFTTK